jgi:hypothetical protein
MVGMREKVVFARARVGTQGDARPNIRTDATSSEGHSYATEDAQRRRCRRHRRQIHNVGLSPVPESRRRTYEQASASSRGQAPKHARRACEAPDRLGSQAADRSGRRRGARGGGAGGSGVERHSPPGCGRTRQRRLAGPSRLAGRNRNGRRAQHAGVSPRASSAHWLVRRAVSNRRHRGGLGLHAACGLGAGAGCHPDSRSGRVGTSAGCSGPGRTGPRPSCTGPDRSCPGRAGTRPSCTGPDRSCPSRAGTRPACTGRNPDSRSGRVGTRRAVPHAHAGARRDAAGHRLDARPAGTRPYRRRGRHPQLTRRRGSTTTIAG